MFGCFGLLVRLTQHHSSVPGGGFAAPGYSVRNAMGADALRRHGLGRGKRSFTPGFPRGGAGVGSHDCLCQKRLERRKLFP